MWQRTSKTSFIIVSCSTSVSMFSLGLPSGVDFPERRRRSSRAYSHSFADGESSCPHSPSNIRILSCLGGSFMPSTQWTMADHGGTWRMHAGTACPGACAMAAYGIVAYRAMHVSCIRLPGHY